MPEKKATATSVAKAVNEFYYKLRNIERHLLNASSKSHISIFRARQILAQSHSRLSDENQSFNKEAIECYNQMIREIFFL